jgi:hypothetical protein
MSELEFMSCWPVWHALCFFLLGFIVSLVLLNVLR